MTCQCPNCVADRVTRVNLHELVYTAWTGQSYWGGCDQRESVERVVAALLAEGLLSIDVTAR